MRGLAWGDSSNCCPVSPKPRPVPGSHSRVSVLPPALQTVQLLILQLFDASCMLGCPEEELILLTNLSLVFSPPQWCLPLIPTQTPKQVPRACPEPPIPPEAGHRWAPGLNSFSPMDRNSIKAQGWRRLDRAQREDHAFLAVEVKEASPMTQAQKDPLEVKGGVGVTP